VLGGVSTPALRALLRAHYADPSAAALAKRGLEHFAERVGETLVGQRSWTDEPLINLTRSCSTSTTNSSPDSANDSPAGSRRLGVRPMTIGRSGELRDVLDLGGSPIPSNSSPRAHESGSRSGISAVISPAALPGTANIPACPPAHWVAPAAHEELGAQAGCHCPCFGELEHTESGGSSAQQIEELLSEIPDLRGVLEGTEGELIELHHAFDMTVSYDNRPAAGAQRVDRGRPAEGVGTDGARKGTRSQGSGIAGGRFSLIGDRSALVEIVMPLPWSGAVLPVRTSAEVGDKRTES
jgi:hypothetical protein